MTTKITMNDEQYFPTKLERAVMIARKDLWTENTKITPIKIQKKIWDNIATWYAQTTILSCIWKMKKKGIGTQLIPPLDPIRKSGRWVN